MNLTEFTQRVNQLRQEYTDEFNKNVPRSVLFKAVHVGYPESMMKYYYNHGYTPENVLEAIDCEE